MYTDLLINLIVIIISQHVHRSNHHVVCLKHIQFCQLYFSKCWGENKLSMTYTKTPKNENKDPTSQFLEIPTPRVLLYKHIIYSLKCFKCKNYSE